MPFFSRVLKKLATVIVALFSKFAFDEAVHRNALCVIGRKQKDFGILSTAFISRVIALDYSTWIFLLFVVTLYSYMVEHAFV